jgi:hypothetical protein
VQTNPDPGKPVEDVEFDVLRMLRESLGRYDGIAEHVEDGDSDAPCHAADEDVAEDNDEGQQDMEDLLQ